MTRKRAPVLFIPFNPYIRRIPRDDSLRTNRTNRTDRMDRTVRISTNYGYYGYSTGGM